MEGKREGIRGLALVKPVAVEDGSEAALAAPAIGQAVAPDGEYGQAGKQERGSASGVGGGAKGQQGEPQE